MTIDKQFNGDTLIIKVTEKLDTITAPELDASLKEDIDSINNLVLDFSELEYISSAGLRILLATQKEMILKGSMVVKNAQEPVMDVFRVTGFDKVLTFE